MATHADLDLCKAMPPNDDDSLHQDVVAAFQFTLRRLFTIMLVFGVWFAFVVYGPAGSALVVGLLIISIALIVRGYQQPRKGGSRSLFLVTGLICLYCSYFLFLAVVAFHLAHTR
jgi:hypothetical protein